MDSGQGVAAGQTTPGIQAQPRVAEAWKMRAYLEALVSLDWRSCVHSHWQELENSRSSILYWFDRSPRRDDMTTPRVGTDRVETRRRVAPNAVDQHHEIERTNLTRYGWTAHGETLGPGSRSPKPASWFPTYYLSVSVAGPLRKDV